MKTGISQRLAERIDVKSYIPRVGLDRVTAIRVLLLLLTGYVWWQAIHIWSSLFHAAYGHLSLGFDLHLSWLAAQDFTHGTSPYTIPEFTYPPSHMLLAWPLSQVSFTTAKHLGLYVTIFAMCGTVAIGAKLAGRRYLGLVTAFGVLALRFAEPAGDETVLLNVSAMLAFLFALSLLLASRNHWITAGAALGLTLAIKPLLFPVLLIFVFARQWKGLIVAVGLPGILNAIGFIVVNNSWGFFSALKWVLTLNSPAFNAYNASLVSVGRILGLPSIGVFAGRCGIFALTVAATWLMWTRIENPALRLVTSSSALMMGLYAGGSWTEDHYMLALIPLLVSVFAIGSPMRWPTAWVGGAWIISYRILSPTLFSANGSVSGLDAQAICRCFGLVLVLMTMCAAPFGRRFIPVPILSAFDRARSRWQQILGEPSERATRSRASTATPSSLRYAPESK